MPDSREYGGTSRDTLNCIRKDLEGMGIKLPEGDNGTIEYQGVKLSVTYFEADQKLAVKILDRPVFVPESMLWQLLETRIQKCKPSA